MALLLFALSAAALLGSHSAVNARRDAITITETILCGDRAAAGGITVLNRTHNDYRLFWDTYYTLGKELEVHTDFLFSQERKLDYPMTHPGLDMSDHFNYTISGDDVFLDDSYEQGFRPLPAKVPRAVAGRTPAGETNEEIIYLKDYYNFYPLYLGFQTLESYNATTHFSVGRNNNFYDITDYLKIPINETQSLRVSVTKDSAGKIKQVKSEKISESGIMFWSLPSVFTDSGCYFFINAFNDKGIVDLPEEVSGIHYIPLTETEGALPPSFGDIRLVYPLEPRMITPLQLLKSPDERRLMLFAEENASITLSVIEAETMSLLQKTVLFENAEELFLREIKQYDDYFMAFLSDGRFCLLQEDERGMCEIELTGDLYACAEIDENVFYNEMAMDYDGQRLAVVLYQERNDCGTYLMVYDNDSLAYAGKYDHSGDRYAERIEHFRRYNPLSVSLG